MSPLSISYILLAHWVGDFLFQTSDMANKKHQSIKWLSIHVAVYGVTLFLFSLLLLDFRTAVSFVGLNVLFHFATDFITSKISAKFVNNVRILYPLIGIDQLIHTATLIYTLDIYQS